MNPRSKIILLSLFLSLSFASTAKSDVECKGGGDNGTPFIDISKEFHNSAKLLHTPGLIKDFQVREKTNELIYRAENNLVWTVGKNHYQSSGTMHGAFSRIVDPWNSFVLPKTVPWVLNTNNHSWYRMGTKENRGKDLYWNGSRVFSLEGADYSNKIIKYSVHNFNGSTQQLSCNIIFNNDSELHIAKSGHTYPYLLLYTTQELPTGTKVIAYALRLEAKKKLLIEIPRCEMHVVKEYVKLIQGKVKALYHFGDLENPNQSAWMTDIEHPKKRIHWSYQDQCTYFDTPHSPILVPNPDVPIIAMQKEEGGIKLFYPWAEKSADIMEKLIKKPLTSDNLWLTANRKSLYVAAQPENENARLLFKVALDQVQ